MALITCPECGKEVSDKAKMCPNCGYPINDPTVPDVENDILVFKGQRYDFKEAMDYIRKNIKMNEQFYDYRSKEIREIASRIVPELHDGSYFNELFGYLRRYHKVPDFNFVPTGDVWKYDLLKPNNYNPTPTPEKKPPVPKCPKCGCTNIQVVPKKWSFFTGFLTNKTERVCANCKYKW